MLGCGSGTQATGFVIANYPVFTPRFHSVVIDVEFLCSSVIIYRVTIEIDANARLFDVYFIFMTKMIITSIIFYAHELIYIYVYFIFS